MRGACEAVIDEHLVDDAALKAGLANGSLTIDTRIRDRFRNPAGHASAPTLADDIALAIEAGVVQPRDSVVRLCGHLGRVDALEAAGAVRLGRLR